ncbi:MAG: selenide, water dikinase SelD, partial [Gemmataceae bacterium]
GRLFAERLAQAGVEVRLNERVTADAPPDADAVLWATDAAPPPLLAASGLRLNAAGFLLARPTLQSVSHPDVFGTGDCVSFPAYPALAKSGVHAVRQGGVLFDNVIRFLREQPLRPFRPQWLTLSLLNTADGEAILSYGPLALKSGWARRWKDRIDRRWVATFVPEPMKKAEGGPAMRCGGCGNKVSGDVLSAVLKRLDIPDDPRVVLGTRSGEDASAHRFDPAAFGGATLEVQTVDYFKSFVDDPFLFGRIAALNAVSDLYAMNARPFCALAIATLPYARGPVQEAMLYELLSGALASFKQLGVVLTGGHTTEGPELALGFAVTGHADEAALFQKGALRPDDVLVLTKPLGTGALLAEGMMTKLRADWNAALFAGMLNANDRAAATFARHGVKAVTDVTGFGLAGHLLEMLDASGAAARLWPDRVPLYPGFAEAARLQAFSTLHADNAKAGRRVVGDLHEWLFDPQTGGGLIAGVRPGNVIEVLAGLHAAGYPDAAAVGAVQTGSPAIHT